ncbi:hypothetical protein PIB30_098266 [Stylosanthes scabra]|uniref:Uncharacterized protein n=1 Tax=Stylosanthes scabra TaxID=79078 RepID=A0ABU6RWF3_9FABA|nr:hypothetical protein [Stylosanthes scabra]
MSTGDDPGHHRSRRKNTQILTKVDDDDLIATIPNQGTRQPPMILKYQISPKSLQRMYNVAPTAGYQ